jgi:hypothetical protein
MQIPSVVFALPLIYISLFAITAGALRITAYWQINHIEIL